MPDKTVELFESLRRRGTTRCYGVQQGTVRFESARTGGTVVDWARQGQSRRVPCSPEGRLHDPRRQGGVSTALRRGTQCAEPLSFAGSSRSRATPISSYCSSGSFQARSECRGTGRQ